MARHSRAILAVALLLVVGGCSPGGQPVDLLREADSRLIEGEVAGRTLPWVLRQAGKPFRINDVVLRSLPAAPSSKLRFQVDVPEAAQLRFSCAITPRHHSEPGIEFVVSLDDGRRQEVLWSRVLDPIGKPEDREWVPVAVDLASHAGREVELILETRGYQPAEDDPRQALWGAPAVVSKEHDAPLVVLYLVDTLRADHTTPYGYERDTTPELLAFSRDAVVFDQAIVSASWTKPSVASIFTSLLPGRHKTVQLRDRLDPGKVTLAEMLSAKGYATGAAIANSVVYSEGSYFEQGFDFFAGLHGAGDRPSKLVNADKVVDTALSWVDARRGLANLVYLHTMDPHVPYAPPAPFDRLFEPHPVPGHPGVDPRSDYKEPLDRERLVAQYDGSIAYGDQEFGRFIRELKARGLYDEALIIFTADHGEEFLDHGKWLHGRSVFDELIRVPLIIKWPGNKDADTRVAQQVQALDLLPTILENEGLAVPPPPAISGRPLQEVVAGQAPERPAVSEISHRGIVAHGMRTGRDKFVRSFSPEEYEAYFDLDDDPEEQHNRIEEGERRAGRLKAGLEAAMVPNPYRHVLRFAGHGDYDVLLRTGGWIEGIKATGLSRTESYERLGSGRKLTLRLRPQPGQPRQVAFSVRPMGAPVRLEGRVNGRPLRPSDIVIAREAVHPEQVPFALPEIETESTRVRDIFAEPDAETPGIQVWLIASSTQVFIEFDDEARARLKALGYIGE